MISFVDLTSFFIKLQKYQLHIFLGKKLIYK